MKRKAKPKNSDRSRLQRMPKRCGANGWWYEGEAGIRVYRENPGGSNELGLIRWDVILRAAQRSYKGEVIVRG